MCKVFETDSRVLISKKKFIPEEFLVVYIPFMKALLNDIGVLYCMYKVNDKIVSTLCVSFGSHCLNFLQ